MSSMIGNGFVRVDQLAAVRAINTQINQIESRNNLPVISSRPLRIGLDISSVCNVNCIFCLAEASRKQSSSPDAFREPSLMDAYEPLLPFVEQVIFSSYEAILNPRFDEFINRLKLFNTPFQLFSNGLGITPELGEFLLRNGMKSLWCSFHGASEKVYKSIMRGSNYETVLHNLFTLKALARKFNQDFKLTLVFCAMRRTIIELSEYIDLARRVGAAEIQVNYLLVTKQSEELEKESVFFHKDLYDSNILRNIEKAQKAGVTLRYQPLFSAPVPSETPVASPCYRPWEHLNVANTGEAQICCGGSPALGNMFAEGFSNLWNSEKMVEFRARVNSDNPPEACRICSRGRENSKEVSAHLTYLRGMPKEVRNEHLRRLGLPEDGEA